MQTPGQAGVSRARYAARDASGGGKSGADSSASDELARARKEIDDQISELQRGLQRKTRLFDEEAQLFTLSQGAKITATRKAVDEEYAAELALLEKERALSGQKPAQRQAINDKIKALESKHVDDIERLNFEAAKRIVAPWHHAIDQISSSLASSLSGMIEGTTKLRDVFRSLAQGIERMIVQAAANGAAEFAKGIATQIASATLGEQMKTAAVATGTAERLGLESGAALSSGAASAAQSIKKILGYAAEAGAGAAAESAPLLGPGAIGVGAAVEAAVAGFASLLPAFETGAWNIPGVMAAVLHPGEMVVPAGPAAMMRAAAQGGAPAGGGDSNVHLHVHAMDGASVMSTLSRHKRDIAKMLSGAVAGNPSLRPSY